MCETLVASGIISPSVITRHDFANLYIFGLSDDIFTAVESHSIKLRLYFSIHFRFFFILFTVEAN